ncbi:CheR family methyltransferase [Leptothoe sp. PORK10 BA2]|uniref:CheR family methyltransferase n=1 Tax=Leptothoe sp. PORK10 BA2 TaxID=3110254 RepID=UPI002B20946B|nr:CheR family methyltransferase [Leptothoe sp. PORK10 BA2]MEA5467069.1 CheR family methyltransferase [Leptothoe sp. PORK10 BA2]
MTKLIADRIGITLRKNDYANFQELVVRRIEATQLDAPEQYYLLLSTNTPKSHQEWEILISEITNTESFFFRDKGQFKLLKKYIFPNIINQKSHQKKINICSAGCSTGEEPYSLAILIKDMIPNLKDWDIKIWGVDVNASAIQAAKEGRYRAWSFRGVDKKLQQQFFREGESCYHIHDEIKDMVDFQVGNLLDDSSSDPFSTIQDIDLMLCRNVFIYFNSSAIEKVLTKMHGALAPLGYLLVGHTELYSQNLNRFNIKMFEESIAYQRPENDSTQPASEFLSIKMSPDSLKSVETKFDQEDLSEVFKGHNIKMHKVALELLRQLPGDSKIAKLGNRTASELITQLENNLEETD